ncbi:MAG: hypothetical protein H6780_02840 [Candidatus Nomurabacteria bacterium]|nr:MAG: hypothetical protein H6780_02840 [Candidatus Nomurabacteria bacterium]
MIPKGLFMQIGMVIVSVAIVFTYVKPQFTTIAAIQDDIALYQQKRDEVLLVNSRLTELTDQVDSVSEVDKKRLQTYLPETLDPLKVSRDLLLATIQAGVLYKDVTFDGEERQNNKRQSTSKSADENKPAPHSFTLQVEGTYAQIKELFRLLEQNNYPLEVQTADVARVDGGFLGANITLVTYSFDNGLDI